MVEDDYEDGEKTYTTVVVTLEGERWQHECQDAKAKHSGSKGSPEQDSYASLYT